MDGNTQTVQQLTAGWGIAAANTMKQSADRVAAERPSQVQANITLEETEAICHSGRPER